MIPYKRLSGDSGILAYQFRENGIIIRFNDGSTYLYTIRSTGKEAIEKMKKLAVTGKGLTTFINRYVRESYEMRLL